MSKLVSSTRIATVDNEHAKAISRLTENDEVIDRPQLLAHLAIALNRTFNLPARYVTGHLPNIGFPDPDNHMDFHSYAEVFVGGHWFTTDARFHVPRIGRTKVSAGHDAVDGAFSTIYGGASLTYFQVWAYQMARGTVGVGDPLDFAQRLDNRTTVQTDPPLGVRS